MKHVFIVNPTSGSRDASRMMVPGIIEAAAAAGLDYEVELTRAPEHAKELAQQYAAAGGPVRLYAVGGDGTLNEVLTGAYPFPNAEVASVPCGSGNDFVRNFERQAPFLDLPDQFAGRPVAIDLMQVNGRISAAIASVGVDADVANRIPNYRRLPLLGGSMAYNMSILQTMLMPIGKHLRVTIDGKAYEGKYLIATVCNGQAYGGGFYAAPVAKLSDSVLDIVLVRKISRFVVAGVIGTYKKGAHFKDGEIVEDLRHIIEYYRGSEVSVQPLDNKPFVLNVDGECYKEAQFTAKVLPLAARFVLPASLADGYTGA